MFILTLLKNYIKSNLSSKKSRRVILDFELDGYYIYIDYYLQIPKKNIVGMPHPILKEGEAKKWTIKRFNTWFYSPNIPFKTYLDYYTTFNKKDIKKIKGVIETLVLSTLFTSPSDSRSLINKLVIKNKSKIRDEKLDKLFSK